MQTTKKGGKSKRRSPSKGSSLCKQQKREENQNEDLLQKGVLYANNKKGREIKTKISFKREFSMQTTKKGGKSKRRSPSKGSSLCKQQKREKNQNGDLLQKGVLYANNKKGRKIKTEISFKREFSMQTTKKGENQNEDLLHKG